MAGVYLLQRFGWDLGRCVMKLPAELREMIAQDRVVLAATADGAGNPHLAATRGLHVAGEDRVTFENWFCMQTIRNVAENPKISLALLDPPGERGFQLLGTVEEETPTEMLDGMTSQEENRPSRIYQAKHRLQVKVESILELSTGPHSDEP